MHGPSSQQMQVQMIDGLPAIRPGVHHDTKSLGEILLRRQFCSGCHELAEENCVVGTGLRERGDVFARDDEQVHGRLRMNVGERYAGFIFIELLRGDFAANDFAEYAVHGDDLRGISLR